MFSILYEDVFHSSSSSVSNAFFSISEYMKSSSSSSSSSFSSISSSLFFISNNIVSRVFFKANAFLSSLSSSSLFFTIIISISISIIIIISLVLLFMTHKQTTAVRKVSFLREKRFERKKEKSGCRITKISREFSALDAHTTTHNTKNKTSYYERERSIKERFTQSAVKLKGHRVPDRSQTSVALLRDVR